MAAITHPPRTSFVSRKLATLSSRLRDPEWRRYGYLLLAGKALGLAVLFLAITTISGVFFSKVLAADVPVQAADIVNPINTIWVLIAAFLVFGMQVGFTMLEAGFCRAKETVNVLMECVVDTCFCGILFYAFGFAFMFAHGNGFIGYHWFFLQNIPATYEGTGVSFLAFWLFQFAFADTCSTITSGSMIGRTRFIGDLLYSIVVSGFIYPIIGHWAWGPDGFLATMGTDGHFLASLGVGFHDFAGSTVVHTIGGAVALAGAIVLGPRLGRRFKRDGGGPTVPHDLTIAASGGLLLWFGWYGFNPGSTLSAMDFEGVGRVATNTTLAACAAGITAMAYAYGLTKKWDMASTLNGFLAGLVAITCPCYWVSPFGSLMLGAVAGVIVVAGVELLEYLRIDDPIGAVPVHGICGIWGTLSLGLFACGKYGASGPISPDNSVALKGLFYGGGTQVLMAQLVGSLIITSATFVVAMGVMYALHQASLLRVSPEAEIAGLDLSEHGAAAYPEYLTAPETVPLTLVPHGGNSERTPVAVLKPAAFAPAMGEGVR
jgi:Amt family ammonium transporter